MATKPAKSVGSSKRPDKKKRAPMFTEQDARDLKKKAKRKGLKPGARNNEGQQAQNQSGGKQAKDARVGSRKPVSLVAAKPEKAPKPAVVPAVKPEKKEVISEQQIAKWERELDKLENDDRLNVLLDKLELEQPISDEDQAWLDQKLERYQELLKLLGLNEDGETEASEDELLQRFIDSNYNPAEYSTNIKED